MAGRWWLRARLRTPRKLFTGADLVVIVGALTLPLLATSAAAADQVVDVDPGSDVGPIVVGVGDVLTVVAGDVTVLDLDVPLFGILPEVVATISPSPAALSYDTAGSRSEAISLTYGSVVSTGVTDVPSEDVLAALLLRPLDGATVHVDVQVPAVEPPVDPPPPVPGPPPAPPGQGAPPGAPPGVLEQPVSSPSRPADPLPVDELIDIVQSEPSTLPATLPGLLDPRSRSVAPDGCAQSSAGGLNGALGPGGRVQLASDRTSAGAFGLQELPLALTVPSLVALMSIGVLAAALGRVLYRPAERTMAAAGGLPPGNQPRDRARPRRHLG